ncbi:hypothetical protein OESDEN_01649 [Oesophagostomum dentatum]|uniref:G-protein coupled receptors family 1 profile domain-containing protein n=1 Tax=Oesophagostomum dentatum TaxID=61180 RepID=A0A0B1TQI4_OESDE|nr:hypothetical protein OESDEN_01649 [Oesophagostomum dentatum]
MQPPSRCLSSAFHISAWLFFDAYHLLLLSLFSLDRMVVMLVPVAYAKTSRVYLNLVALLFLAVASCALISPAFNPSIEVTVF